MRIDDFVPWRKAQQEHGLFTTAYRYDNPNIREANMIGNLYIDFDIADIDTDDNYEKIQEDAIRTLSALTAIFGIPKEMVKIYFSGSKGIHLTIPIETLGVQPHPELNNIFKLIADDISKLIKNDTVDTRIYDKVRLFRVPNSIHPKTGLYKIPITFDELRDLSLVELKNLAQQPRQPISVKPAYIPQANRMYQQYMKQWEDEKKRVELRKKKGKATTLSFMPACIQHLLEEGAKEGKRNNSVAVIASYFMQRGIKEDETLERVLNWNDEFCNPSLPEREIEKTVASIYRSEHRYGCRTLSDISVCDTKCRLYKPAGRN